MGQPAAKQDDQIVATDTHMVMVPAGTSMVPTPLPHPFVGTIKGGLSADVFIDGKPAATVDSTADNTPHIPTPPGVSFNSQPANKATIKKGSGRVFINGKAAARNGDIAQTCNDPTDMPVGSVIAVATVMIGD